MINYAIFALIVGSLPFILVHPFFGVLAWHWVGIMNPHRLAWGFASGLPVAMMVGSVALLAFALSREPKRVPLHPVSVLLAIFCFWMTLTSIFALVPDAAWPYWEQTMKILFMTFVTMALLTTRERVHALVWVIVISLGFYALKGGMFTLLTGGNTRVWGPPQSFIGNSNQLALALIMLLPLVRYLQLQTEHRLLRIALAGLFVVTFFSIIGSYSRGALVGLVVMGVAFVLGSRHRVQMAVAGALLTIAVFSFSPQDWFDRMGTIETYDEDQSAMSRIMTWEGTFDMALDKPIQGFGFQHYVNEAHFFHYVPDEWAVRSAHSIYFQVLGEHGFIGLGLFLATGIAAVLRCGQNMRLARGDPERQWAFDLAQMLRLSFLGYAAAGAFLNLAYFDLYYTLLAVLVGTDCVVRGSELTTWRKARNRTTHAATDDRSSTLPVYGTPSGRGTRRHRFPSN